jgi:hypothetical protein
VSAAARQAVFRSDLVALESDVREVLRQEWIGLGRRPEDFGVLWDLYWSTLGPLAPTPDSVHDLDEVLVR